MHHKPSLLAVCLTPNQPPDHTSIRLELQKLINEFSIIFWEPKGLSQPRDIKHQIILREGMKPINVWLYWYAHFQKVEIERQVNHMLDSRLIRPSTSPFSSPVLLVRKLYGFWLFCTDYRALNLVTVKDKFLIPTVDNMLDESHGAQFFTKLDLDWKISSGTDSFGRYSQDNIQNPHWPL